MQICLSSKNIHNFTVYFGGYTIHHFITIFNNYAKLWGPKILFTL